MHFEGKSIMRDKDVYYTLVYFRSQVSNNISKCICLHNIYREHFTQLEGEMGKPTIILGSKCSLFHSSRHVKILYLQLCNRNVGTTAPSQGDIQLSCGLFLH